MQTESQAKNELSPTDTATDKKSHSKHSIKSSRFRVQSIARQNDVSAQIDEDHDKTLQERSESRQQNIQKRQQQNLERIFRLCYDNCLDETAGEPDPDWIHHFMTIAQNIYSPSMQKLWSRILRQEIITPGSISLKAMIAFQQMTQRDAQLFRRACLLACHFGQDNTKKLLTGLKYRSGFLLKQASIDKLNLGHYQLPYSHLLELMGLGLILSTELESGKLQSSTPLPFHYQGNDYQIQPAKNGVSLLYYRFSPVGQEIAQLLGNHRNEEYQIHLTELLNKHFIVSSDASTYHPII
ncbi:TIGR03899 family protein [Photobacterium halotolerans]|uniref:TIGR03899 family protein n=1 Tax=Photobacterium halotolerans TaxID=265726 RepID=A0A0F5V914_9GAMM|nr:TIGR03899 family protein [Photobacterium halotolerans]KKC98261.1 hypothetical protein KY46_19090 [Photobacterium halotolerans]